MYKNFFYYLLSLSLIIFYLSFNFMISIKSFDSYCVKKNIEYLSSEEFNGRLAGTVENIEASNFIKNKFIENKLSPLNNNYYHNFTSYYPEKIPGKPYLRILNKDKIVIKDYIYSKDFKEEMLNFKSNKVILNSSDKIHFDKNFFTVSTEKGNFLFFVPENDNLNFRSSFFPESEMDMYIMITQSTKNDIEKFIDNDCILECFIPFKINKAEINNVTAFIKGKNSSSPIVLSAHFDHLGSDLNNTVYPGALDNASGTAFIIEMSKYLKSIGKPTNDILFIAFNGEEFGCLGSKKFVQDYYKLIESSKVFNFDMIGTDNSAPLCIMGGKNDSVNSPLIKSTANVCSKEKIYFNYLFEDSSDHSAFTDANINAITLIDNDSSRIHTPNDKASFISKQSIDRCFKIIQEEIINYAFDNNPLIIHYKAFSIISFIVLIILFNTSYKLKRC